LTKRVAGSYLFDHDWLAPGQLEHRLNVNPEARVHSTLRILPGASAADAIPRH